MQKRRLAWNLQTCCGVVSSPCRVHIQSFCFLYMPNSPLHINSFYLSVCIRESHLELHNQNSFQADQAVCVGYRVLDCERWSGGKRSREFGLLSRLVLSFAGLVGFLSCIYLCLFSFLCQWKPILHCVLVLNLNWNCRSVLTWDGWSIHKWFKHSEPFNSLGLWI